MIEVFIERDQAGKLHLKSQQTSEGTFVYAQAQVSFQDCNEADMSCHFPGPHNNITPLDSVCPMAGS